MDVDHSNAAQNEDFSFMDGLSDQNLNKKRQGGRVDSKDETAALRAQTAAATETRKKEKASKVKEPSAHAVMARMRQDAKPAPAKPPSKVPEDIKYKTKLLNKITGYKKLRPDIKPRSSKTLTITSSTVELEDEVLYIQTEFGKDTGPAILPPVTALVWLMQGLEVFTQYACPHLVDIRGVADDVGSNQEQLEPLLSEMMVKYNATVSLTVEMRLLLLLSTIVTKKHLSNTGNPAMNRMMEMAEATRAANQQMQSNLGSKL